MTKKQRMVRKDIRRLVKALEQVYATQLVSEVQKDWVAGTLTKAITTLQNERGTDFSPEELGV